MPKRKRAPPKLEGVKHPLLDWLDEVGQTVYWLAKELECDRPHLYRIILGERVASARFLAELSTFTRNVHPPGVTVEQMIPKRFFQVEQ